MSGTSGKKLDGSGKVWPEKHSSHRARAVEIHDGHMSGKPASTDGFKPVKKFEPSPERPLKTVGKVK